jgi:hypothetical protein
MSNFQMNMSTADLRSYARILDVMNNSPESAFKNVLLYKDDEVEVGAERDDAGGREWELYVDTDVEG